MENSKQESRISIWGCWLIKPSSARLLCLPAHSSMQRSHALEGQWRDSSQAPWGNSTSLVKALEIKIRLVCDRWIDNLLLLFTA